MNEELETTLSTEDTVSTDTTPAPMEENVTDTGFSIPEEYAGNQDISSAPSMGDLCKTIVNQQKLIGKKYVGIPNENSTPEEIAKYREAIGVPVNFEDYDFGPSSPEVEKEAGPDDPTVNKAFKQLLFDAGISQSQAKKIRQGYDQMILKAIQMRKNEAKQIDDSFEKLADEKFGASKAEKIKIAQQFLKQNISDNVKDYLPYVLKDNKALLVVADMANNIYPNMKPESIRGMDSFQSVGMSEADIRSSMQSIIASKAFQDKRHTDHEAAVNKVNELAKQIVNIRGGV